MSEELIIRHCSPTLAGLKTANLFKCSFCSKESLKKSLRTLNRRVSEKGLRILLLKTEGNTALIYVYRPQKLKTDFSDTLASTLLKAHDYPHEKETRCIVKLIEKLKKESDFPHEIGLFLGYPPEDVQGFIENNAKRPKYTGYWRVYGDEEKAKKLFSRFKKCTAAYTEQLKKGDTIEQLIVAV